MARVTLPESRAHARRRRRLLLLALVVFIFVVLCAAGVTWLSNAAFLRISTVEVLGTQTLSTSTIAAFVEGELAGSYLYFFPKNNIFLYPKEIVSRELLSAMPTIAEVNLRAKNFHTLAVAIIEHQPKALWCGEVVASSSPCFLLDENGLAYAAAADFSGDAYQRYYGALAPGTSPRHYLTSTQFHSLSALVDTIAQNQKPNSVRGVLVDQNSDVRLTFASGFVLLFPLGDDGGDIYQRFTLALQSDAFKAHPLSDFQYLDLRFGDKLYYKLK